MALAKETGKRPVILVQDELRARVLMEDLSAFADGDVLFLQQSECNLADVDASSRDTSLARIGVIRRLLTGDFGAIVIPAGALLTRMMPVEDFSKCLISLRLGMRIRPVRSFVINHSELPSRLVGKEVPDCRQH